MTGTSPLTHRQVMMVLTAVMVGAALAGLDGSIVASAIPTITADLGGVEILAWLITAYLLASAIASPLCGKLGDLYGRKRIFQAAILVFTIGSVLCGLAQNMAQLVAFRAVQGVGGGSLISLSLAIVGDVASPRERGRYMGYVSAVVGLTAIAGPVVGGFFSDHLSWRWVFLVNIPLGALALALTVVALPESRGRANPIIDYWGAILLAVLITSIVLFTTWGGVDHAWASPTIIGLIAGSVVILGVLIVVERRQHEPMLPVGLFRLRTFTVATMVSFTVGLAVFGALAFIPLYLQVVHGESATNSGLLLLPLMMGGLVGSVVTGQLMTRTGRYKIFPIVGCALCAVATLLMSTMGVGTPRSHATVFMVLLGLGNGIGVQTLVISVQNEIPSRDMGAGTSAVSYSRSMGGSIGTALFGALFNSGFRRRLDDAGLVIEDPSSLTHAAVAKLPPQQAATVTAAVAESITTTFVYVSPLLVLCFIATCFVREIPLRARASSPDPELAGVV